MEEVRLDLLYGGGGCPLHGTGMEVGNKLGWNLSLHTEVLGSRVRHHEGNSLGCTPAICLRMPVNDWIEKKYKQDSRIVLENHQAGKGEKPEHSMVRTLPLMPSVPTAVPKEENTEPSRME